MTKEYDDVTDRDLTRAAGLVDNELGPVTVLAPPSLTFTASQRRTMVRALGYVLDRVPAGEAVRYDVATLAATTNVMPAGVPLLRIALDDLVEAGTITADPPSREADRTYVFAR
ncbi:hypothetical protein [Streptomyces sp. NPDC049879]|uniref:hypothetical protein n=1 Tax=Streptomyces sp. NPDC049879 TaxID=3365598 RepID=UPI003796D04E